VLTKPRLSATLRAPPLPRGRCPVCSRGLDPGEPACRNPLCASAARWFRWNLAISERGGRLQAGLDAYKYRGARRWGARFGALAAGFLAERPALLDGFDLVTASPTFVGEGGRSFDHTRTILAETARRLDGERRLRFDLGPTPAIVRTGPTDRLAGRSHEERRRIAVTQIRRVLRVPAPGRTTGRRILVLDDVFTDGRTLDETARALRLQGGAREVCGLSLLRQPWHRREDAPVSS
jgi:predicted amidophosphoribosyltransferase